MTRRGTALLFAVACVLVGNAYLLRFRPQLRDLALYRAELADVEPPAAKPPQRETQDVAAVGRRLAVLLQACGLAQESAGATNASRRTPSHLAWTVRGSYAQLLDFLRRVAAELPEACVQGVEIEYLGPGDLRAALQVAL